MRAVIQRVSSASVVVVEGGRAEDSGRIRRGLVILLGVRADDTETDARWLADKIATLRIFADGDGKMNLALRDVAGGALVVSNFTLYADCRKGRRPSFTEAASGDAARLLYEAFCRALSECDIPVETGVFGAEMRVGLENDGPVTLVIDTPPRALPADPA
jgi:D-aminoacyl-tRNA deacylase